MRRMFDLLLKKLEKKTVYGMFRVGQVNFASPSVFSYGITWAECDKIVFDLYYLTSETNHILFCTPGGAYIGYTSPTAANFTFTGLTNGKASLSPAEVTDGGRHKVEFTFSATATTEITNTWDRSWAKRCGYVSVEFWKGNTLLKRFVPSAEDGFVGDNVLYSDYMIDTISGEKIQASITRRYVLQEMD